MIPTSSALLQHQMMVLIKERRQLRCFTIWHINLAVKTLNPTWLQMTMLAHIQMTTMTLMDKAIAGTIPIATTTLPLPHHIATDPQVDMDAAQQAAILAAVEVAMMMMMAEVDATETTTMAYLEATKQTQLQDEERQNSV